jgi:hypothetical protein
MPALDPCILLEARSLVRIIHHVPGRVRLRADPRILDAVPELISEEGRAAFAAWRGIEDIRINPVAFSLVIRYDPDTLDPAQWEALLEGSEEEARSVVEHLRNANS